MIYLDHAATTPLDPLAAEAMAQAARQTWGNPSSVHTPGRAARAALEQARHSLASLLHCTSDEVIFTASASEANNHALKGAILARPGTPAHLVISAIEHESIRTTARYLAARWPNVTLTEVAPDSFGIIHPEAIQAALRPDTALVAVMHSNNETGTIQPIEAISPIVQAQGIPLLCDAVQSFGKLPLNFNRSGCTFLSLSAHKFHGPRGAGVLLARTGVDLDALIHGGLQEHSRRAGTENLPAIAGMAAAAEHACRMLPQNAAHLARLEDIFLQILLDSGISFQINGSTVDKLKGVINLSIPDLNQDDLIVGMDLAGVAISAGSACSSGVVEPSHVLEAMGLPDWRCRGSVRFSFGRENTPQDAETAARALVALAQRLEAELPAGEIRR